MTEPLLIDESLADDGSPRQMHLALEPARLDSGSAAIRVLDDGAELGMISEGALAKIMGRYGRPLDARIAESLAAELARPAQTSVQVMSLSGNRSLARMKFRAAVDAASRDYVVWREPGREPLAALGRQLATALRFVLQSARARS